MTQPRATLQLKGAVLASERTTLAGTMERRRAAARAKNTMSVGSRERGRNRLSGSQRNHELSTAGCKVVLRREDGVGAQRDTAERKAREAAGGVHIANEIVVSN